MHKGDIGRPSELQNRTKPGWTAKGNAPQYGTAEGVIMNRNKIDLAYRDPRVSRLRHDAENRRTAYQLLMGLIGRTADPTKRDALQLRADEQMALWNSAVGQYEAALQAELSKYEAERTA
jgi:hypothetical protein